MGCAFDIFTTSWRDRAYTLTLLILCWFIPLLMIFISYNGIIYRVKSASIRNNRDRRRSCMGLKKDTEVVVYRTRISSFMSTASRSIRRRQSKVKLEEVIKILPNY